MPHSSGGGSAGGGFSGGSGSGRGGAYHGHAPHKGAKAYHYTTADGKEHTFYATGTLTYRSLKRTFFTKCLFSLMFAIFGWALLIIQLPWSMPFHLYGSDRYFTGSYLQDTADVFTDEEEAALIAELEAFHEKTGVIPYVYTLNNEAVIFATGNAMSFETLDQYAYDLYVRKFSDETHFLVVYSEDIVTGKDWYWCGMQGDYTDRIVTRNHFSSFQKTLQGNLENTSLSIGDSFIDAFHESLSYMTQPDLVSIFITLVGLVPGALMGVYFTWFAVKAFLDQKEINEYQKSLTDSSV